MAPDIRPTVEEVLEINVSLSEPVSMNIQQELTKQFSENMQIELGVTTIGGEVVSDSNIQVLVRNAASFNSLKGIERAIDGTFTDYEVEGVNIVVSKRRIVAERQGNPFLSRSTNNIVIRVPTAGELIVDDKSISDIISDKSSLVKDIDKQLSLTITESSVLTYENEEDKIVVAGLRFETDMSQITLTQLKSLQNVLDNNDEFDVRASDIVLTTQD